MTQFGSPGAGRPHVARARAAALHALLGIALVACSGERARDTSTATESASRNAFAPPNRADDSIAVTRVAPVELPQDDEATAIMQVASALVLSDQRLAIVDQYSLRLHIFDSALGHLGATGGKGEGPGEMMNGYGMFSAGGDTIAVWDSQLRRLSLFTPEPKFVRVERDLRDDLGSRMERPIGRFADGRFVLLSEEMNFDPDAAVRGSVSSAGRALRVGFTSGPLALTLPPARMIQIGDEQSVTSMPVPGGLRFLSVCERGVVVVLDSTLTVYDDRFRKTHTFPYEGQFADYPDKLRRQQLEFNAGGRKRGPSFEKDVAYLDRVFPKPMRSWTMVVLDADGVLWHSRRVGTRSVYARTTLAGETIDTLQLEGGGFPNAMSGQRFIAMRAESDTSPPAALVYRAPRPRMVQSRAPSLGRCSTAQTF